jgi:hypothetical protein
VRLSEISASQGRRKPSLRSAGLLIILIGAEGIGTLLWLLMTPSEPARRALGAYSLERWGLIAFTAILVVVVVYLYLAIKRGTGWVATFAARLEDEKRAAGLLLLSTLTLVVTVVLHVGLLVNARAQSYYPQLLPLLAFMTLAMLQIWIYLLVALAHGRDWLLRTWFPVYRADTLALQSIGRNLVIAFIGISVAYLFVQARAWMNVPRAVELGDTTSYLEGAGMSLRDPAFFSERRPWGILLIYKLLGGSLATIGFAQLAFSTLAWLSLAWMLAGSLQSSLGKLLGFVVVLGISLSPAVQVWNHAGLSESFSISTLTLILALLTGLLQSWRWPIFLALVFFFAVWVSIHEVNLYLGLMAAATLFALGLLRKTYRSFLILSFCIAVMLVVNSRLSSLYALPRWALPVAEVITMRVLPVPQYLDYFTDQGMPVRPELMALSGRWAHSDNYAILNNPMLRPFSKWLFEEGKTVYTRFLIAHPIYTLTMPLLNLEEMLAVDFSSLISAYRPALPGLANEFFFPIRWFWVYLAIFVPLLVFVLWKLRREKSRIFWLTAVFFTFSIPYLYLAWHADALDVQRHAAIANIQFHLGSWLLLVFYLDRKIIPSNSLKKE